MISDRKESTEIIIFLNLDDEYSIMSFIRFHSTSDGITSAPGLVEYPPISNISTPSLTILSTLNFA